MSEAQNNEAKVEQIWRTYLTTGEFEQAHRQRRIFSLLPGAPRCNNCFAPFEGAGSHVVRLLYGRTRSNLNPRLCNNCEQFASQHQGGADIELSLLFADVRGSTQLAETMSSAEYSRLINRFYDTVTGVMVQSEALIDKIMGDQLAAMFVPAFAGSDHARRAVEAGKAVMEATGHGRSGGPWIPLGAGVHTGTAFVGSVKSETGVSDITVLGDTANTTARLASAAGQGEILISDEACEAADLDIRGMEARKLDLKGKSRAVGVHVISSFS